ncbi:MAG: FMN-binding protein [Oscillospiraceae bacterium]|nr:FMN-binding protein [Oscillospiraceae bacterium]
MKENIKSVVVLTAICLVVAVLLAYTNSVTAPIIEANKAAAASGSLLEVMPEAAGFENITETLANLPATVKEVHKETSGLGHVMILGTTTQFSSDEMGITVAIGADGKISNVLLTGYYESKDFGADYPSTYIGQDSALGGVDTVAGTTFSSTAFKDAITDAFNVLIENNLVAAGQKSEEQLIAEVMPLALPSSADSLGNCQVTAVEGVAAPITQAFKANNGTGYIYVITGTNGTVVAGVNAFGVVKVLDLEGNDVTAAEADAAAAAQSAAPVLATENLENNTAAAQATVAEGAVLTPVEGLNVTGTAIAAFVADANGETQYVVITAPLGYSNETMKMITVFDAEGNVIFYKTLTELILHGEYYATHELTDESAYRQMFIGVNAGTYSDDMTLVAGATMTANAVASSFNSAFEALDLIKEVVA